MRVETRIPPARSRIGSASGNDLPSKGACRKHALRKAARPPQPGHSTVMVLPFFILLKTIGITDPGPRTQACDAGRRFTGPT